MSDVEEIQDDYISKTEKKRELALVQEIAEKLLSLNSSELAEMGLQQEVLDEVAKTLKIKSHGARRRQLRYLIQVIFNCGYLTIQAALEDISKGRNALNNRFHLMERLRDGIVGGSSDAVQNTLEKFPEADRQHLRNLQRNILKEKTESGKSRMARVVFKYLREVSEA